MKLELLLFATVLTLPSVQADVQGDVCDPFPWHQFNLSTPQDNDFLDGTLCCIRGLDNWLGSYRHQEYIQRNKSLSHIPFENTTFWDKVCRRWKSGGVCIQALRKECDLSWTSSLIRNRSQSPAAHMVHAHGIYAFYDRTCEDDRVRTAVREVAFHQDVQRWCLKNHEAERLRNCTNDTLSEIYKTKGNYYQVYLNNKRRWDRLAESALRCMRDVVRTSSCEKPSQEYLWHVSKLQIPSIFNVSLLYVEDKPKIDFADPKRCTIGVYGDPHLRLCDEKRLITCAAAGRVVYLSNQYMHITAINDIVVENPDSRATVITWLQIVFKYQNGASYMASYTAGGGKLPEKFDGFSTPRTVIGQGKHKLVMSTGYDTRVVISHYAVGVVYMIRQWKGNYFFSVRLPESLLKESHGMLVTGCPAQEFIEIGKWIGRWRSGRERRYPSRKRRAMIKQKCYSACEDIEDEYFRDSCQFDCIVTGNTEISSMMRQGEKDVKSIVLMDRKAVALAAEASKGCHIMASLTLLSTMIIFIASLLRMCYTP